MIERSPHPAFPYVTLTCERLEITIPSRANIVLAFFYPTPSSSPNLP